jgi:hypothetical protein
MVTEMGTEMVMEMDTEMDAIIANSSVVILYKMATRIATL